MLTVGDRAPAFTLPDHNGDKVELADLKGKWVVLYFYPKDDTPGCTIEACEFTTELSGLRALDAVVYGCSPDSSESHRKFMAKHDLDVPLLADPQHKVMAAYDAFGEKNLYGRKTVGVIRSTVLIDPDGVVAHHWKRARPRGHAEKVAAKLRELRG